MNQDQLNKIRLAAGVAPKYDRAERQHLAETEDKKVVENQVVTEAANNRAPATALAGIARKHLGIRTLKTQNKDDKDFHDVSVWAVENALKAAFKAGQDSVKTRKTVKEGDESKAEAKKGGTEYCPKGGERYPADDKCDPDVKETAKSEKKGTSAENYKTPKNKSAKQVVEAKKADKDYDGDGKVESSEAEHKGAVDKKIKAKKKLKEMDLELDMGDEGDTDMKKRRMDLIRGAVGKVQGPSDMGDEEMDMDDPMADEYSDEADRDDDMMGDEEMDMDDMEWDDDEGDRDFAMGEFMPEDEEAFAGGYDAFVGGQGEDGCPCGDGPDGRDWKNGYETARFSRMSSVAEGSSEGYNNPKGKAGLNSIAGSNETGANAKKGNVRKTKKGKSEGYDNPKGKAGLKKIKEAQDATVLDKDYHHPVGANGHLDLAQKGVHVQNKGMEEKVNVPPALKKSLKEEIANLTTDAGKVRYRDEYRSDFYEATAEAFSLLLAHLEEGTKQSMALAQIDLNRVMSPMTERLPRDVYMYIVRGGKPASLTELFKEVKVKSEKGADPSKEKYTK